ncbi:MAG: hypothetical protein LBJ10_05335 [Clostridiales bacterium]|nr:hypothetical protein [Clostridiales bacterium]
MDGGELKMAFAPRARLPMPALINFYFDKNVLQQFLVVPEQRGKGHCAG